MFRLNFSLVWSLLCRALLSQMVLGQCVWSDLHSPFSTFLIIVVQIIQTWIFNPLTVCCGSAPSHMPSYQAGQQSRGFSSEAGRLIRATSFSYDAPWHMVATPASQ